MKAKFLNSILGQRSKLEALRCLFSHPREMTGREIARLTGLSHPIILKALDELEGERVVQRRIVPPTHQFQLNKTRWVVSQVLAPLFEKEKDSLSPLTNMLIKKVPPSVVSMILFGSVIKGETTPKSDVDVLILVRTARDKEYVLGYFLSLGQEVYEVFGLPLAPIVFSVDEFREKYRTKHKFAKEIAYTGRVVYGKLLTEVL